MSDGKAEPFAAIPGRAIGDRRFTGSHFRVLGAIALHDRMSASRDAGQGCWASNKTLATKCGINYTNLSTIVTDLARWGYLIRESHPLNKRLRIYRIIYDSLPVGKGSNTNDNTYTSPAGKSSEGTTDAQAVPETAPDFANIRTDDLPAGEQSTQIVCPEKSEVEQDQGFVGVEYIPQKRKNILPKQVINSAEAAPMTIGAGLRSKNADNDGAYLATVERYLRAEEGSQLSPVDERQVVEVAERHNTDHPLYHQAQRILGTWGAAA